MLGLRVKATPVPDVSPMLPKTMVCDVDRGAEVVGDGVGAAVGGGPDGVPGSEDSEDGGPELLFRIGGEGVASSGDDTLVGGDELAAAASGEVVDSGNAGPGAGGSGCLGKMLRGDLTDDAPKHLDDSGVGVEGEVFAVVAGPTAEAEQASRR